MIEKFNDESSTEIAQRDDLLWANEILPRLIKFCAIFHEEAKKSKEEKEEED